MIVYLRHKLEIQDYHGVQDAASDIREIDAKLSVLEMKGNNEPSFYSYSISSILLIVLQYVKEFASKWKRTRKTRV